MRRAKGLDRHALRRYVMCMLLPYVIFAVLSVIVIVSASGWVRDEIDLRKFERELDSDDTRQGS